jgi:hypothetical protein
VVAVEVVVEGVRLQLPLDIDQELRLLHTVLSEEKREG